MKKLSAILAVVAVMFMGYTVTHAAGTDGSIKKLQTNGRGVVTLAPDISKISFSVNSIADTEKKALSQTSTKLNTIVAALVEAGISKDDISTGSIYVYPEYSYVEGEAAKITGYSGNHHVMVIVRNIERTGEIFDLVIDQGATSAGSIEYAVSDATGAYNEALQLAIKDARQKAEAMEKALGTKLIGIIEVVEISDNYYSVARQEYAVADMSEGMNKETEIYIKDLEIYANVQLIYAFE